MKNSFFFLIQIAESTWKNAREGLVHIKLHGLLTIASSGASCSKSFSSVVMFFITAVGRQLNVSLITEGGEGFAPEDKEPEPFKISPKPAYGCARWGETVGLAAMYTDR